MHLQRALLATILLLTAVAEGRELGFREEGKDLSALTLPALKRAGVTTVTVEDPYYERRKSYHAVPLRPVLEAGFGRSMDAMTDRDFVFRALDGYTRLARGALLAREGGYLAIADAEHAVDESPGWQPIDRRQVDPGPFYVVWAGAGQNDPHRYPWPYQLAAIEIVTLEERYPHMIPRGISPDAPAWAGFATFRDQCFSCHAINGEGGRVGPELNVPRSVVEYRPLDQLKAFIRDPESFRYTTMPSHQHLSEQELDQLLAYFQAMSERKRDPGR